MQTININFRFRPPQFTVDKTKESISDEVAYNTGYISAELNVKF